MDLTLIRFGYRTKGTEKNKFTPSPSHYDLEQYSIGKQSLKYGFGTEMRKTTQIKSISPGPGAYNSKSMAFEMEKPRFFMGNRINPLKPSTSIPGAGTYNP